jgi:hypothetical protein
VLNAKDSSPSDCSPDVFSLFFIAPPYRYFGQKICAGHNFPLGGYGRNGSFFRTFALFAHFRPKPGYAHARETILLLRYLPPFLLSPKRMRHKAMVRAVVGRWIRYARRRLSRPLWIDHKSIPRPFATAKFATMLSLCRAHSSQTMPIMGFLH